MTDRQRLRLQYRRAGESLKRRGFHLEKWKYIWSIRLNTFQRFKQEGRSSSKSTSQETCQKYRSTGIIWWKPVLVRYWCTPLWIHRCQLAFSWWERWPARRSGCSRRRPCRAAAGPLQGASPGARNVRLARGAGCGPPRRRPDYTENPAFKLRYQHHNSRLSPLLRFGPSCLDTRTGWTSSGYSGNTARQPRNDIYLVIVGAKSSHIAPEPVILRCRTPMCCCAALVEILVCDIWYVLEERAGGRAPCCRYMSREMA